MAALSFLLIFISIIGLYGLYVYSGIHYVKKLMFELPWLKWITLADAKKVAPSMYCRLALPVFHQKGYLETRLLSGLGSSEKEIAEKEGFQSHTLHFYEFRLVKRKSWRKKAKEKPKEDWKTAPGELPA
jgi:hypothetical protein